MNKIWLIIKREYITRVRKRLFIVTTLLAPVSIAALVVVPILLASYGVEEERIAVLDESGIFHNRLENRDNVGFEFFESGNDSFDSIKSHYGEKGFAGILHIPESFTVDSPDNIEYYSEEQLNIVTGQRIENQLNEVLRNQRLQKANITDEMLEKIDAPVRIVETKQQLGDAGTSAMLGYFMGFLIYIVMLIYGTLVMRGVIEEKTSRIAEVIISSVKPFQLMMGKIIGIAFVGLTQFFIWIILTGILMTFLNQFYASDIQYLQQLSSMPDMQQLQSRETAEIASVLIDMNKLPLGLIAFGFVFFFLCGYLLYASLFAAIGAASGDEGDQSLTFIATLPIIISIILMISIIQQPNSKLAIITSMIPLCSPIIMAARLPFVPPLWEIILSMVLLVLGFLLMVWVAAKIYRTGILMYGKKGSLKEMIRWVRN